MATEQDPPIVAIIDDDLSFREALTGLVTSFGFHVLAFASAAEFLRASHAATARCLLLDIEMPDMSGFELQDHLNRNGSPLPVVFVTSHLDTLSRARALHAGALGFLGKPFDSDDLLRLLTAAIERRQMLATAL